MIDLDGGWMLNHYGGTEAFLGWLAMQPVKHSIALACLSDREAKALGPNIKRVETCLRSVWEGIHPDDPIERVYVAYFLESSGYHLHVHLIPRVRSAAALLRSLSDDNSVDAWRTPKLSAHPDIRLAYRKTGASYCARVRALMSGLATCLDRPLRAVQAAAEPR